MHRHRKLLHLLGGLIYLDTFSRSKVQRHNMSKLGIIYILMEPFYLYSCVAFLQKCSSDILKNRAHFSELPSVVVQIYATYICVQKDLWIKQMMSHKDRVPQGLHPVFTVEPYIFHLHLLIKWVLHNLFMPYLISGVPTRAERHSTSPTSAPRSRTECSFASWRWYRSPDLSPCPRDRRSRRD